MVDKLIADDVQKIVGKGEKVAPVKSVKLKVKFDTKKGAKTKALKGEK